MKAPLWFAQVLVLMYNFTVISTTTYAMKCIYCMAIVSLVSVLSYGASVTWDADGASGGQVDGAGNWLDADQWWTGSANTLWSNGDDANMGLSGSGGIITLGNVSANSLTFGSFSGTYTLTGGKLALTTAITAGAGAGTVVLDTPVQISGGASIASSSAGSAVLVRSPLIISGAGNRTLTLVSGNSNTNGFSGAITNGAGAVVAVTLNTTGNASRWGLSGTNTFTGMLYAQQGWLYIQGKQALPPEALLYTKGHSSARGSIAFLDDSAGTISFPNTLQKHEIQTSAGGGVTLFVGNNSVANGGVSSGTTTGSTIAVERFLVTGDARVRDMDVMVTGANGYRLQFQEVNFQANWNTDGWPCYFIPSSAPITLAGEIRQLDGNTQGTYVRVALSGTAVDNHVTGVIADPADYTGGSNSNARPTGLLKTSTSEWTLAGMNTFTGATVVNGGTLILDGPECLSDVASLTMSGSGVLQLNKGVKDKVDSLILGATPQAIGSWGSSASRAQNKNDTYFSGEGLLYVGVDLPALGTLIILL